MIKGFFNEVYDEDEGREGCAGAGSGGFGVSVFGFGFGFKYGKEGWSPLWKSSVIGKIVLLYRFPDVWNFQSVELCKGL